MKENIWNDGNIIRVLKENGVVVMPTDTLYGIVGRAEDREVVARIYKLRKRALEKPCIILIGDIKQLEIFCINISEEQNKIIKNYWPGPVSIVLDCSQEKFSYLHRGTKTLAFRLPAPDNLKNLLLKVGPLVAPSANIEGLLPAKDITQAKDYFGSLVDLYVDNGTLEAKPSKIIRLYPDGSVAVLRA